jgi:hypothetical protein
MEKILESEYHAEYNDNSSCNDPLIKLWKLI